MTEESDEYGWKERSPSPPHACDQEFSYVEDSWQPPRHNVPYLRPRTRQVRNNSNINAENNSDTNDDNLMNFNSTQVIPSNNFNNNNNDNNNNNNVSNTNNNPYSYDITSLNTDRFRFYRFALEEYDARKLYGMIKNDWPKYNDDNGKDVYITPNMEWQIHGSYNSNQDQKYACLKIEPTLNNPFPTINDQKHVKIFDQMLENQCKALMSRHKNILDQSVIHTISM